MKSLGVIIGAAAVFAAGIGVASAQALPTTVDGRVGAAKSAAGLEWPGTFLRLCIPPPPTVSDPTAATAARPATAIAAASQRGVRRWVRGPITVTAVATPSGPSGASSAFTSHTIVTA